MLDWAEELRLMQEEEEEQILYEKILGTAEQNRTKVEVTDDPCNDFLNSRQGGNESNQSDYNTTKNTPQTADQQVESERKRVEFEEAKASYLKLFYSTPRVIPEKGSSTLFCGQGNSYSKSPNLVKRLYVESLQSVIAPTKELTLVRMYRPYANKQYSRKATLNQEMKTSPNETILSDDSSGHQEHIDEIDGHPEYGWEQVLILKVLFDKLDADEQGYIELHQFLSAKDDPKLKPLLRFTLFSAWFKLRKHSLIEAIFSAAGGRISFKALAKSLTQVSRETEVHSNYIRLDSEMKSRFLVNSKYSPLSSINKIYREAYLKRVLKVGDVVWGLYSGGVHWFPAVIEEIRSDGHYDLSYTLSSKRIKHRVIVDPSSICSYSIANEINREEIKLLKQVYDLVDAKREGILDSQKLLTAIESPQYSHLVKSSLALATLAMDDSTPLCVTPNKQKSFHQIVLNAYYEWSTQRNGKITRDEFVEVGLLVIDLVTYNMK